MNTSVETPQSNTQYLNLDDAESNQLKYEGNNEAFPAFKKRVVDVLSGIIETIAYSALSFLSVLLLPVNSTPFGWSVKRFKNRACAILWPAHSPQDNPTHLNPDSNESLRCPSTQVPFAESEAPSGSTSNPLSNISPAERLNEEKRPLQNKPASFPLECEAANDENTTDQAFVIENDSNINTEDSTDPLQIRNILSEPVEQFLKVLDEYALPSLAASWRSLLSKVPETCAKSFKRNKNRVLLTFSHRVALWIDSRNKKGLSYPFGGTVILLGEEKKNLIEFEIDQENSKIIFLEGVGFYCNTPIGKRDVVVCFMQEDEAVVTINAGCQVPFLGLQARSEEHPNNEIIKTWEQATYLDKDLDYKKYLNNKISQLGK